MRVAAKDQSVIESAAPYRNKLTTRKLPIATMKKKKMLHECAKLLQNMLFFDQTMGTNYFLQIVQNKKKIQKHQDTQKKYKHKNTQKKITQKLPSQTDYKNHDICIL